MAIGNSNGGYSGNFPCEDFACNGCPHRLVSGRKFKFPFKLIKPLGEGGFATVYSGQFHKNIAAFKFIPVPELHSGKRYNWDACGCYEYDQQDMG